MAKVIKLHQRTSFPARPGSPSTIKKVAAYARVSTGHDAQLNSFEAQKDYYTKLIEANPEWELAGIYADCGLSGTSKEKRPEFNRMIQDCKAGKIQMIITKSVSRFARNTVDSLNTIRELKGLGIGIRFEKEDIFTLDSKGEFLITLMSSLSQEESRNLSENITWGKQRKAAAGRYSVVYSRFLGYDKGEDGGFKINPEQAVVVRHIFRLSLIGYGGRRIAAKLAENGILSATGNLYWNPATVVGMIRNESYKGDKLLQKTYTADFLTKKTKRNKGERPQYYVTGGHAPIIEPTLYDYILERLGCRSGGMTPLSTKMFCGECGNQYGPFKWHKIDSVWQCQGRVNKGCTCSNTHIYDYALRVQLREVLIKALKGKGVLSACRCAVQGVVADAGKQTEIIHYLNSFYRTNPESLIETDDYYIITDTITVFSDKHIEVKLIDGNIIEHNLRRYTPKAGWTKSFDDTRENPNTFDEVAGMTNWQKTQIESLRSIGLGYRRISTITGIARETIRSHFKSHPCLISGTAEEANTVYHKRDEELVFCKQCGRYVPQNPHRKKKVFCCKKCGETWFNWQRPRVGKKPSTASVEVPCGSLLDSREGSRHGESH